MSKLLNIPHDDYKIYSGSTLVARFDTWFETRRYLGENDVPNARVENPNPRAKMTESEINIAEYIARTWDRGLPTRSLRKD
jgi:hypothetical protein